MEFKLTQELSTLTQGREIGFNYEELKAELTSALAKYQGRLVTEEDLPNAKKDRATLRKVREAIDKERKAVKGKWLEPYQTFETKCKELMSLCDAPAQAIDAQIKQFEEQRKLKKLDRLQAYWRENGGKAAQVIAFERVMDAKWGNATAKEEDCQSLLLERAERYNADLTALANLGGSQREQAIYLDVYLAHLNLGLVMQRKAELDQIKNEQPKPVTEPPKQPDPEPEDPSNLRLQLWVEGTPEQLQHLKAYLRQEGIRYGRA